MDEEIDPAENRDEFIERVERIYDYSRLINDKDFKKCVLTNDTVQIQTHNDNLSAWDTAKNQTIADYDSAIDLDAKRVVVGSITLSELPR